jgi:hypothetical protein
LYERLGHWSHDSLQKLAYVRAPQLDGQSEHSDCPSFPNKPTAQILDTAALQLFVTRVFASGYGTFPKDTALLLKDVPKDGNCMYHAIAEILRVALKDPKAQLALDHVALRMMIWNYYRTHRDDHAAFWVADTHINAADDIDDRETFDQFLENILKDGHQGTQPIQTALESILSVNIVTLRHERELSASKKRVYQESFADTQSERLGRPAIVLLFHPDGSHCGGHYNAVVPSALTLAPESVALLHSAALYSFPSAAPGSSGSAQTGPVDGAPATSRVTTTPSLLTSASAAAAGSPAQTGAVDGAPATTPSFSPSRTVSAPSAPARTPTQVVHDDVPSELAGGWYKTRVLAADSDTHVLETLVSECGLNFTSRLLCVGYPSTALRAAMLKTPPRTTMCVALDSKHHTVSSLLLITGWTPNPAHFLLPFLG